MPSIYDCTDCDRSFTTLSGRTSHQRIHKPLVNCDACGEDVKNLEMHKRKFHPEEMGKSEVAGMKTEVLGLRQRVGRLERENKELRSKLGKLMRSGISV